MRRRLPSGGLAILGVILAITAALVVDYPAGAKPAKGHEVHCASRSSAAKAKHAKRQAKCKRARKARPGRSRGAQAVRPTRRAPRRGGTAPAAGPIGTAGGAGIGGGATTTGGTTTSTTSTATSHATGSGTAPGTGTGAGGTGTTGTGAAGAGTTGTGSGAAGAGTTGSGTDTTGAGTTTGTDTTGTGTGTSETAPATLIVHVYALPDLCCSVNERATPDETQPLRIVRDTHGEVISSIETSEHTVHLAPGSYQVQVISHRGGAAYRQQEVTLSAGQTQQLTFEFRPCGIEETVCPV